MRDGRRALDPFDDSTSSFTRKQQINHKGETNAESVFFISVGCISL